MANKKSKSGKAHKGGGKPGGNPPKPKGQQQQQQHGELLRDHQIPPQERVEAVRPFWESQGQEQRVRLLTVDVTTLKERARSLTEAARQQAVAEVDSEHLDMLAMGLEPSLEEVLDEGVSRLTERSTWKLWSWPADQKEFTDAESFRQHIADKHIREELRKYLPRDDPKSPERPAEEAFRKRMTDLLTRIQQQNLRHYDEMAARTAGAGRERAGKDRAAGKEKDKEKEKEKNSIDKIVDKEKDKEALDREKVKEADKDGSSAGVGADSKDKWDKEGAPVSIFRRRRHHAADTATLAHDTNIELINIMLEALEQEHEVLYQTLIMPIIAYVMEALSEERRDTHKMELVYEDLDKLQPDDLIHIMEWLTEKVDALSTKLKAELKEEEELEEEENMGDVDLWSLADEGKALTVNGKWLQHLQERLLGEDGHPRKVKAGEDPHSNGLVLEWVYGTIVSTAEKARDGAKRPLGSYMPLPNEAHHALVRALEEQYVWDTRLQQARTLLGDMLKSRLEATELAKQFDIKPVPKTAKPEDLPADDALPDHVIVAMLRREVLLTKAKLHYLLWEHLAQERQLRTWKSQLKQGEPEFERLKKELDDVKHSHRGLDSTYRSQAEMERHRAQLADAAIEEQLEVQTAFREQGALLQSIYDKKQRAEYDIARKETEIKQLQGWKGTVESIIDRFQDLMAAQADKAEPVVVDEEAGLAGALDKIDPTGDGTWEQGGSAGNLSPNKYMQLVKLRNHVHKDIRKQLYSDADDKLFFDNLKNEVKAIERKMEEARVVIQHLEMQLLNVACDDPGIAVGAQLVLPLLQETLDSRGRDYAAERAKMAESEVIRMELEQAEREAAERERKRAAKAAKTARARSEKEKERADREAREAAEAARRQQEEESRKIREEEDRRKRLEALEAMRKAEEECIEARRRELMSDENGYWRQRMRFEEQQAAALTALTNSQDHTVQARAGGAGRPDTSDTLRPRASQGSNQQKPGKQQGSGQREAVREHQQGPAGGSDGKRSLHGGEGLKDSKSTDQTVSRDKPKSVAAAADGIVTPVKEAPAAAVVASPDKPSANTNTSVTPLSADAPAFASHTKAPEQAPAAAPVPVVVTPAPSIPVTKPTAVPAPDVLAPPEPLLPHHPPAPAIYFGAVPVAVAAPPPAPITTPAQPAREPVVVVPAGQPAQQPPHAPLPHPAVPPSAHPPVAPQAPPMPITSPQAAPHVIAYGPGGSFPAPPPPPPASRPPAAQGQPAAPPTPAPLPIAHNMRHVMHAPAGQPLPNGPPPPAQVGPHGPVPMNIRPAGPMMANAPVPVINQAPHPAGRMPNPHVPQMHAPFQPMMGPPGSVVVPGPAGPMYLYPNASAGPAGMMPSAMMHAMVGQQQHPQMNGIHPGAMPNMQQQQQQGAPQVHLVQQQQQQHMPPHVHQQQQQPQQQQLKPQAAAGSVVQAVKKEPSAGGESQPADVGSPASTQESTPAAGSGSSAGAPVTSASDRSLNVAAKPFVPSAPKPVTIHINPVVPPQLAVPLAHNPPPPPMSNGPTLPYVMHVSPQQGGMQQPHTGYVPGFPQQQGVRPQVLPMAGAGPRGDRRTTGRQQPGQVMHMGHVPQQLGMPPSQQAPQFMMMPNGTAMPVMLQHSLPHQVPHMQQVQPMMQHQGPMQPGMVHQGPGGNMVPGMVPGMVQPQLMGVQQHPAQQQFAHPQPHALPNGMQQQQQQPSAPGAQPVVKQQQAEQDPPQQVPISPDGPLDRSQASSASEDSTGGQHSSADQAAKQQQPQQTEKPPVEQQKQQQSGDEQQAPPATSSDAGAAAPKQVEGAAPAPEAVSVPSVNGVSTQTAVAPPVAPSPPQPRSWSAIAAKDRTSASPAQSISGSTSTSGAQQQQGPGSSSAGGGQASSGPTPTPPGQAANNGSWKEKLQHSLPPAQQPVQNSIRWAGTPPGGNFMSVPSTQLSGARLRVTDTGLTMYEAPGVKPRSLQLIRGLRNGEGEYNCFLNVIIQSLWHLKPFREALLALTAPAPTPAGTSADTQVLHALSSIFKAMATTPAGSASTANGPSSDQQGRTVSPAALRTALAALDHGQAAVRVETSEMHDASEVLGQILECLHRAEAAAASPGSAPSHDITLPQKVKMSAAGKPQAPASIVHRLFGLDMQVPCPADEEGSKKPEEGSKKLVRNQRSSGQLVTMPSGSSHGGSSNGGAPPPAAPDVLQFTKFFHLVPAQGLRKALADALLPSGVAACSWEELLVAVEAAGGGEVGDADGRPHASSSLLRRPGVFSLALVWESPQVPPEAIRSTLAALGPAVELPAVFRTPASASATWPPGSASTYTLRAVVCYFGHHYLAFVLSEELELWLCFDDADISLVGRWADVCKAMLARRMQPSLLIYEDLASTNTTSA